MQVWCLEHPWMTFVLAWVALWTISLVAHSISKAFWGRRPKAPKVDQ